MKGSESHKSDRVYLQHILECTALIKEYTSGGKDEFMRSALLQDAVIRRLQTMAESTQRLSTDLTAQTKSVDWRAISGFRNILVHDYINGIDLNRVWDVVENYLLELEAAAQVLMKSTEK